jgi:excisionase family DNA binding protein
MPNESVAMPLENASFSPEDLRVILGISRRKVYDGLNSGQIPSIRLGRRFIIPKSSIARWLEDANRPTTRAIR